MKTIKENDIEVDKMKKMSFLVIGLLLLSIVAMSGCTGGEETETATPTEEVTPVEEIQGNVSPNVSMPPEGNMSGNNSTIPPAEAPGNNSTIPPAK